MKEKCDKRQSLLPRERGGESLLKARKKVLFNELIYCAGSIWKVL